jgi:hypothetical protein
MTLISFVSKLQARLSSIFIFLANYKSEQLLHRSLRSSASPITASLLRDGYYIYPEPLSPETVDCLVREYSDLKVSSHFALSGQLNRRIFSTGRCLTPTLQGLADSVMPDLLEVLVHPRVELTYFQESVPENSTKDVPGGSFHVDDNKSNYKYFIYLTDVSELNGPFSVVSGTGSWKLYASFWRGLFWELTRLRIFLYGFGMSNNTRTHTRNEHRFTGRKGSHFIVDTTCLHRDNAVIKGERSVAVISFNACRL